MKIDGVKYLDANNFDRIIIRDKKGLNVKVNSKLDYVTEKSSNPFSKELKESNDINSILKIVNYFLRNNVINKLEDEVYIPYYIDSFSCIGSNDKRLYLQILSNYTTRLMTKNIINKYHYDRNKVVYNLDDIDFYNICISYCGTSYDVQRLKENKVLNIHLKKKMNKNELEDVEKKFIIDFIKYKLDVYEEFAQLKYHVNFKNDYFLSGWYLTCNNLCIRVEDSILLPILNKIIFEHNEIIRNQNRLQLKLEGF